MNLCLIFAVLTCFFCNAQAREMQEGDRQSFFANQVREHLKDFVVAENDDQRKKAFEKLITLSDKKDPSLSCQMDSGLARLANMILSCDGFSENYTRKLILEKQINVISTLFLGALWGGALLNSNLYDFEKKTPILALTGASVVGTLAILSDYFVKISDIKKYIFTTAAVVGWISFIYFNPQDLSRPWDLISILFPVTAGLTKRFILDTSFDYMSRRFLNIKIHKSF